MQGMRVTFPESAYPEVLDLECKPYPQSVPPHRGIEDRTTSRKPDTCSLLDQEARALPGQRVALWPRFHGLSVVVHAISGNLIRVLRSNAIHEIKAMSRDVQGSRQLIGLFTCGKQAAHRPRGDVPQRRVFRDPGALRIDGTSGGRLHRVCNAIMRWIFS